VVITATELVRDTLRPGRGRPSCLRPQRRAHHRDSSRRSDRRPDRRRDRRRLDAHRLRHRNRPVRGSRLSRLATGSEPAGLPDSTPDRRARSL